MFNDNVRARAATSIGAPLRRWMVAFHYYRFPDLVARGIVSNRTTLARWIKQYGFPQGVLLGPNSRAWPVEEIETWLRARASTERNKGEIPSGSAA